MQTWVDPERFASRSPFPWSSPWSQPAPIAPKSPLPFAQVLCFQPPRRLSPAWATLPFGLAVVPGAVLPLPYQLRALARSPPAPHLRAAAGRGGRAGGRRMDPSLLATPGKLGLGPPVPLQLLLGAARPRARALAPCLFLLSVCPEVVFSCLLPSRPALLLPSTLFPFGRRQLPLVSSLRSPFPGDGG